MRAPTVKRSLGVWQERWRDPWAWACLLAVLPILIHSWGALLGEPAADDYDFLYRALLNGGSWFDGGGSVIYWRPISRQLYYTVLGPLMLTHPRTLALLHAVLLAAAALLIYRALRPRWDGATAALAATFPMFAEGTRTLVLWPAAFQDLGALLFSALAVHQAARGRQASALVAVLAGLLCKEITLIAVALLPWMPAERARPRWRFALASAAVVGVWGSAYFLVRRMGGVLFQRHLEEGRPALIERLAWAFEKSGRDAFNLEPGVSVALVAAIALAVLAGALVRGWRLGGTRSPRVTWALWGLSWFALATAMLSETSPVWGSFRSAVGLVGLGIAVGALMPGLGMPGVILISGLRMVTFFMAPAPPSTITQAPTYTVPDLEFETLARLQRYVGSTRAAVTARFPALPPGAAIGQHHRPLLGEIAFADGRAAQLWYRDTTLRWVSWQEMLAHPEQRLATVIEYQPYQSRQITLIDAEAMSEYLAAVGAMKGARFQRALDHLGRADSLQSDRGAAVFLGTVSGKRALCALGLNDASDTRRQALRALELWPDASDARYCLAVLLAGEGDGVGALAELDTLLFKYPFDESAKILRDSLRAEERASGG